MKPETEEFIAYARRLLLDARTMLASGLPEHAARTAYLACFHVARAYVFERIGHAGKTHKGVQIEFARLSKDDPGADRELRAFLSRAYAFKAMSDYGTALDDGMSDEEADEAVQTADRFVHEFARLTSVFD